MKLTDDHQPKPVFYQLLESDAKMRFLLLFGAEEYNADKEEINGQCNCRVSLYFGPGLLHLSTPMDIVKDQDCLIMGFFFSPLEIAHRWFKAMITIDKGKINLSLLLQPNG